MEIRPVGADLFREDRRAEKQTWSFFFAVYRTRLIMGVLLMTEISKVDILWWEASPPSPLPPSRRFITAPTDMMTRFYYEICLRRYL